jgi:hypothetical protein
MENNPLNISDFGEGSEINEFDVVNNITPEVESDFSITMKLFV